MASATAHAAHSAVGHGHGSSGHHNTNGSNGSGSGSSVGMSPVKQPIKSSSGLATLFSVSEGEGDEDLARNSSTDAGSPTEGNESAPLAADGAAMNPHSTLGCTSLAAKAHTAKGVFGPAAASPLSSSLSSSSPSPSSSSFSTAAEEPNRLKTPQQPTHGATKNSAATSPLPQFTSSPPSLLSSPLSSSMNSSSSSAQSSPDHGASSPGHPHQSRFHTAPRASTAGGAGAGANSAPTAAGANRNMHRRGSTLDKFMENLGNATVAFTAGLVDEVHGKEQKESCFTLKLCFYFHTYMCVPSNSYASLMLFVTPNSFIQQGGRLQIPLTASATLIVSVSLGMWW